MITGRTRTFGLLGHPVAHSRSPELHNAWFEEHGVDARYVALDVDPTRADQVVSALRTLPLAGVNLTIPFKEAVVPALDAVVGFAGQVGAVNTVVRDGDRLIGHNTDGFGFLAGLRAEFGDVVPGARVLVLGAGGAGLGVGAACASAGARSVIWLNRDVARAQAACDRAAAHWPSVAAQAGPLDAASFAAHAAQVDLVIAATSGAAADTLASFDVDRLGGDAIWCDLNYWMSAPPSLARLRARGVAVQSGMPMLVYQAAEAFRLFTGLTVDAAGALRRMV